MITCEDMWNVYGIAREYNRIFSAGHATSATILPAEPDSARGSGGRGRNSQQVSERESKKLDFNILSTALNRSPNVQREIGTRGVEEKIEG